MRAGSLDRYVTIEKLTESRDNLGGVVETWSTVANIWCKRAPNGIMESFLAQQRFAAADMIFETRWYSWAPQLDPKTNRFVYRERIYELLGAEEIGRKDGLHLIGKTRTDLGGSA